MRQTIILVTIAILGVSLVIGVLVGNLAGGADEEEAPFATLPAGVPSATPVASPSPTATIGLNATNLMPWT